MTNKEMIPGESYKPREFFTGGGPKQHQPITGSVTAIDAKSGAIVAKHETEYPMLGGILDDRRRTRVHRTSVGRVRRAGRQDPR